MARGESAALSNEDYAERLGAKVRVVFALDDARVEGKAAMSKALSNVHNTLKKNSVEFVTTSASNKHSVVLTRFGVAIGTLADQEDIIVGKLERDNSHATPSWQITNAKLFAANDSVAILRQVTADEKAAKESARAPFKTLVARMRDIGIIGTEHNLRFITKMGHAISVRTSLFGREGIWAIIDFKHGKTLNRIIGEPGEPDEGYAAFVANLVRHGEIEELGWGGRRRDVHYGECGHKSAPKVRTIEHNCGCSETTTVTRKGKKAN